MTVLSLPTNIKSLAHLVSGLGMGVSIGSIDIVEVDISNGYIKSHVIGADKKVVTLRSVIKQITEVVLVYEAGYQIHFSCSLEETLYNAQDGAGIDKEAAIEIIKKHGKAFFIGLFSKETLLLDLSSKNIGLEAWENISITIQNEAVLNFLKGECLVWKVEAAQSDEYKLDGDDTVHCNVKIEERGASNFIGEVQSQISGYSTDENGLALTAELVCSLKKQISEKSIELIS